MTVALDLQWADERIDVWIRASARTGDMPRLIEVLAVSEILPLLINDVSPTSPLA